MATAPRKTTPAKKSSAPAKKLTSARKALSKPVKRAAEDDDGKTSGPIVRMGPSLK